MSKIDLMKGLATEAMVLHKEMDEWDTIPLLYIVGTPDAEGERYPVALSPVMSKASSLPEALTNLARGIEDHPEALPPLPFHGPLAGLMFRSEGYALMGNGTASIAGYTEWFNSGRKLADHPDAKEVVIFTVMSGDNIATLTHARGGSAEDDWAMNDETEEVEGAVVDSLRKVYWALLNLFDARKATD